jgi:hypothetical protein
MTDDKLKILGKQTAKVSFIIGTVIFGFYFLTSNSGLLFFGFAYIVLAVLFNLGVLFFLFIRSNKENKLLKTCAFMLLNIPVTLLYCWGSIILLNTMRVTLVNSTSDELTDIKITGCETNYIDKLQLGESKTIWVKITGDCSINIDYLANGQRKEENVAGYVTNDMGQKITYRIGGVNNEHF